MNTIIEQNINVGIDISQSQLDIYFTATRRGSSLKRPSGSKWASCVRLVKFNVPLWWRMPVTSETLQIYWANRWNG